jgi:hypothetical protein
MEQDDGSRVWDTTTTSGAYWVLILYVANDTGSVYVASPGRQYFNLESIPLCDRHDVNMLAWKVEALYECEEKETIDEMSKWVTRCCKEAISI